MNRWRTALMVASCTLAAAVWAQQPTTTIENFDSQTNILGLPRTTSTVKEGTGAGRWEASKSNTSPITQATFPTDWTGKVLTFWLHSEVADGGKVVLTLASEDPKATEKGNYYAMDIIVDWQGWKQFRISSYDIGNRLRVARKPAGWSNINGIQFWGQMGGTPKPTTILTFDDIRLEPVTDADANAAVPPLAWKNPSFEGEYKAISSKPTDKGKITGVIANGWGDNSTWAEIVAEFAEDQINPHSGKSSQRIDVKEVKSGAVQFVQSVMLKKGQQYQFSACFRGTAQQKVDVIIRKGPAPYTAYVSKTITLTDSWQEIMLTGTIPEVTGAYIMVIAKTPVTFWIDDAKLVEVPAESIAK